MKPTYGVYKLRNSIQEYAWGSKTAIAEFLGNPSPTVKPQAELWLGAHPKAPSFVVLDGGKQLALPELIARDPRGILGAETAARFSDSLPFLFKVLAAAQPLSIQAHPNLEQARLGFERENEQDIALDAFQRNYRDNNHKPEVISALTPFWALNGFRPFAEMLTLLEGVCFRGLASTIRSFRSDPSPEGLKHLFSRIMNLNKQGREQALAEAAEWARRTLQAAFLDSEAATQAAAAARWIAKLGDLYPGDVGVLSPLLLNIVYLQPGDTMFMEAGVLHAYLERVFLTPAEEFLLSEIRIADGRTYSGGSNRSVEMMICLEGRGTLRVFDDRSAPAAVPWQTLAVNQGDSLLVPAALPGYTIEGELSIYKASVPIQAAGTQDRRYRV
jgi:mannose-6-phosphate isomerase